MQKGRDYPTIFRALANVISRIVKKPALPVMLTTRLLRPIRAQWFFTLPVYLSLFFQEETELKIVIVGAGKLGFDLARVLSQENPWHYRHWYAEAIGPIADNLMWWLVACTSVKILEEVLEDYRHLTCGYR